MRRAAVLASAATLVLVPASAGAGTNRPSVGLTATPARVALAGADEEAVRVTNPGLTPVVVDVGRAGFSLTLRGQPRIVPRGGVRAAAAWLTARPARFLLQAGASRSLTITSRLPRRVEPGDHDALVLLTTRPRGGGVAVRMRLGIVVVVRAPGLVVRHIALGSLRVGRAPGGRLLELRVVNRGNVTETLGRGWLRISLGRGRTKTTLVAAARALRPRTSGVVQLLYRGWMRGRVTARAEIASEPGRPAVRRAFRVKL